MSAEKKYYNIVSRGEDRPETLPKVGVDFDILIRLNEETLETAHLTPEYVEMLGPYTHVIGQVVIAEMNALPCIAKYLIDAEYAEGGLIGTLVVQDPNDQV